MIFTIGSQGSEQVVIVAAHGFIDYHVNVCLIPAVTSRLLCEATHKVEGITVLTYHLVINLADGGEVLESHLVYFLSRSSSRYGAQPCLASTFEVFLLLM